MNGTSTERIHLIVPMAGRGSRFMQNGQSMPKPMIDLHGRPFFWWAVESVRRTVEITSLQFVVLREHVNLYRIDEQVLAWYPQANIVITEVVTGGSAETAMIGLEAIQDDLPIAINDCDHAFRVGQLPAALRAQRESHRCAAMVTTFASQLECYSYAQVDNQNFVYMTAEKKVISNRAISGCYIFTSAKIYKEAYEEYIKNCPYNERFISGIYNVLLERGEKVVNCSLDHHYSFGTPEELNSISFTILKEIGDWR